MANLKEIFKLKREIKEIGTGKGYTFYEFNIKNSPQISLKLGCTCKNCSIYYNQKICLFKKALISYLYDRYVLEVKGDKNV